MSIVNKTRRDVNSRHTQAHNLMQQSVALNAILQSPEYMNCLTIDKAYVNSIAANIINDFNVAVANLTTYDASLNVFNSRQLSLVDHVPLLNLDQLYIAWCDHFTNIITPAICTLVDYIQSHFGVVVNG